MIQYAETIRTGQKDLLGALLLCGAERNQPALLASVFDRFPGHHIYALQRPILKAFKQAARQGNLAAFQAILAVDLQKGHQLLLPADLHEIAIHLVEHSRWSLFDALLDHVGMEGTAALQALFRAVKESPVYRDDMMAKQYVEVKEVLITATALTGQRQSL